ncbi:hypothetical protein AAFF_G00243790 [Aldrovandia affinis]|uniref:Uncharacterized protein n=1 Tax=Aldrovandia affinis TaxID=143900 RepID=A0AAD7RDJ7_9TELE|nr:hypothetical protein AAFF_G00243790 [Aldrovandia affinis]
MFKTLREEVWRRGDLSKRLDHGVPSASSVLMAGTVPGRPVTRDRVQLRDACACGQWATVAVAPAASVPGASADRREPRHFRRERSKLGEVDPEPPGPSFLFLTTQNEASLAAQSTEKV